MKPCLATVLTALGDAADARFLMERAVRVDVAAFGPEHPEVATDLSNLAVVLKALGDAAGARQLLERAVMILKNRLGVDHPTTERVSRNLMALAGESAERS